MGKIKKNNKDVFQSYILTVAKYKFSIYEKRILYRLVDIAQKDVPQPLKNSLYKVEPSECGVNVTMPVADILKDETDNNYAKAKKAFKDLSEKGIEYEDSKTWLYTAIIEHPVIEKGTGIATFHVYDPVWRCILDFGSGYRKYELETAMSFKSVYSMRMYELLSGQKTPLSFNVEDLLERFKLAGKYKRISTFEEKVLEVAKRELDEHSPYSFTYERITRRSRGRQGFKVTGYTFTPKFLHKNRDMKLEEKELNAKLGNITGRFGMLDKNVSDYLLYNLDIPKASINSNKSVFLQAQKVIPDHDSVLAEIGPKMREKDKPIGYLINTLKGKVADAMSKKK